MTNEEIIKNYLEEQIKVDSALAEKYNAQMVPDCIKAIISKANKIAVKQAAMVKSETVFKWARDFFIDGDFDAVQADNHITEETPVEKIKGVTAANIDVEAIKAQAKKEALKEFREEAKAKAEAAALEKAAAKAAKEREKFAAQAKLEAEKENVLSLF